MSDEKDKWMDEVFQSMKGSQRAKPGPELFAKIESQIEASNGRVIPMHQWRYAAAAAAVILFVNVSALFYYGQSSSVSYEDVAVTDIYGESLISNYQIYQ